jgi:hypothetical protein
MSTLKARLPRAWWTPRLALLEPSGGGDASAGGVVGYRGAARIEIYRGTAETVDPWQAAGHGDAATRPVSRQRAAVPLAGTRRYFTGRPLALIAYQWPPNCLTPT